jgi:hypothetical protein
MLECGNENVFLTFCEKHAINMYSFIIEYCIENGVLQLTFGLQQAVFN